ncbi:phosphate ABC transporter substrate-binding protein [Erythrobacter sp. KY5]|uniref:substrate-binding domain-containing protein n=1 Tax=Erythrobacter sp. KY5 TaxID=2011159 RepID=UPI000DBF284B|nr:substrate-binding domain-containing protein [Erythrobacter sp. KY5]AWW73436.1 phosphate ABC transporter substrate-binding protein [Erythrobacter sp. KY5]
MTQPTFFARNLLVGASLAMLVACGGSEGEAGPEPISIVGSSTVFPFSQKVAEDYVAGNEGAATPVIVSTGTGEGIEEFCAGQGPQTADIVNASRQMTKAEFERCRTNGVSDIIELKVGLDGIVFVSELEEGIDLALTPGIIFNALAAAPFGEEQTAMSWSDVDSSLPDEPIIVYGPPVTSGTRDALLDVIMAPACRRNGEMAALEESDPAAFERGCHELRSDEAYLDQGEQDDLLVRKVANNPRAIGVLGYSYLEENTDSVKGLPIGGVEASAETIADGSYAGSRALYIYVKKAHIGVTPGLEDYLAQWSQSWGAEGPLAAIGLVPMTAADQTASAAAIESQTVMTAPVAQSEADTEEG